MPQEYAVISQHHGGSRFLISMNRLKGYSTQRFYQEAERALLQDSTVRQLELRKIQRPAYHAWQDPAIWDGEGELLKALDLTTYTIKEED